MLYCFALVFAYGITRYSFSTAYSFGLDRHGFAEPGLYFTIVHTALMLFLVLCALGVHLRFVLAAAALLTAALNEPLFTKGLYPMTDVSFFVLVSLWITALQHERRIWSFPLTPLGDERISRLSVFSIQLVLGSVYLNSFLNKIFHGGMGWLNGTNLEAFLRTRALFIGSQWPEIIAQSQPLLSVLGIVALIFEGGFIFSLFSRRARIAFAILGLSFHVFVLLALQVNFAYFYLPTYLIFVDWSRQIPNMLARRIPENSPS